MRHACVLLFALALGAARLESQQVPRFEVPAWDGRWFKDNTHTHTTESDGDSPPEVVARWYRERGCQFLVPSLANTCRPVRCLKA